jgi:hypothetical protein
MITKSSYCPWFISVQPLSLHLNLFGTSVTDRLVVVSCDGFLNAVTQERGGMPPVLLHFFAAFVIPMLEFSLPYSITIGDAKKITMKLFLYTVKSTFSVCKFRLII